MKYRRVRAKRPGWCHGCHMMEEPRLCATSRYQCCVNGVHKYIFIPLRININIHVL